MADGCVAEIGFTLAPAHHGKGYASEAAGAMIDALFAQTNVHRIAASIDPANVASMRVLEHLGFRYEGTARRAELVRGEWVDDMQFALLRDDRTDWLARPTSCQTVELVEITTGNLQATVSLATHRYQEQFVAPMARSFSQALIPPMHNDHPVVPWMRAVQADGEIVGFMMLSAASPRRAGAVSVAIPDRSTPPTSRRRQARNWSARRPDASGRSPLIDGVVGRGSGWATAVLRGSRVCADRRRRRWRDGRGSISRERSARLLGRGNTPGSAGIAPGQPNSS